MKDPYVIYGGPDRIVVRLRADSPREVIKVGFANGFLTDANTWLEALESRNRLTHTYEEKTAEQAVKLIRESYYPMIRRLYDELKKRL